MPFFDGITLCRMIREIPRPAPIYIILLTGKTSAEEAAAGLEAGADDYPGKPFDREALKKSLENGRRAAGIASPGF